MNLLESDGGLIVGMHWDCKSLQLCQILQACSRDCMQCVELTEVVMHTASVPHMLQYYHTWYKSQHALTTLLSSSLSQRRFADKVPEMQSDAHDGCGVSE